MDKRITENTERTWGLVARVRMMVERLRAVVGGWDADAAAGAAEELPAAVEEEVRALTDAVGELSERIDGAVATNTLAIGELRRGKVDKETWNTANGQFNVVGMLSENGALFPAATEWRSSEFIPINRNYGISCDVSLGGGGVALILYDESGKAVWTSGKGSGTVTVTLEKEDIPAAAVYFRCATVGSYAGKRYSNGENTESREGAMVEMMRTLTERAKRQVFIDQWNVACGGYGTYNIQTGFFELNGLTDITYKEAVKIHNAYSFNNDQTECGRFTGRTNIPMQLQWNGTYSRWAQNNTELEVAVIPCVHNGSLMQAFYGCTKMHTCTIYGTNIKDTSGIFSNCHSLKNLIFKGWDKTFYLSASPLLTIQSLRNVINGKYSTTQHADVGVHPDVYAKLTGDTTNDAYNDLTDEEKAQWTALPAQAAAKNITFITV